MHLLHIKIITSLLAIFLNLFAFSSEENFLLINGQSSKSMLEMGSHIDERFTPCSTFKIALSLMGYDSSILQDRNNPVWPFQEGYDDFLELWKFPQTPMSWMKNSCVWFSRVLATRLGTEKVTSYLAILDYGNQNITGGLTNAWLNSSLKISPREQVIFIQKMLKKELLLSFYAMDLTKQLLFLDDLPDGWKLFGKTGWSGSIIEFDNENELGWFVGWIEKGEDFFVFAYNILEKKINLSQRVPRVKQLLEEAKVMNNHVIKMEDIW